MFFKHQLNACLRYKQNQSIGKHLTLQIVKASCLEVLGAYEEVEGATVEEVETPAVVLLDLQQGDMSGIAVAHLVLVRHGEEGVGLGCLHTFIKGYLLGRAEYALARVLPVQVIRLHVVGHVLYIDHAHHVAHGAVQGNLNG